MPGGFGVGFDEDLDRGSVMDCDQRGGESGPVGDAPVDLGQRPVKNAEQELGDPRFTRCHDFPESGGAEGVGGELPLDPGPGGVDHRELEQPVDAFLERDDGIFAGLLDCRFGGGQEIIGPFLPDGQEKLVERDEVRVKAPRV